MLNARATLSDGSKVILPTQNATIIAFCLCDEDKIEKVKSDEYNVSHEGVLSAVNKRWTYNDFLASGMLNKHQRYFNLTEEEFVDALHFLICVSQRGNSGFSVIKGLG